MDRIRQQLNSQLHDSLGDEERRHDAEGLVASVCDGLDRGDDSPEQIAETVKAALAPALEQARVALARAEQLLGGRG